MKHESPIDLDKLRGSLNSVVAAWVAELDLAQGELAAHATTTYALM